MKLNKIIKIRVSTETDNSLNEIADKIGLEKSFLVRYLINSALQQLKRTAFEGGGFDKLNFKLEALK